MMMIQVGFPRPVTHPPVRPGKLPQARKRCRGDLSEVEVAGQDLHQYPHHRSHHHRHHSFHHNLSEVEVAGQNNILTIIHRADV